MSRKWAYPLQLFDPPPCLQHLKRNFGGANASRLEASSRRGLNPWKDSLHSKQCYGASADISLLIARLSLILTQIGRTEASAWAEILWGQLESGRIAMRVLFR